MAIFDVNNLSDDQDSLVPPPSTYLLAITISFLLTASIISGISSGGWLRSESTEWFLFSVANVGRSFVGIQQQGLLRRDEVGFVAPFAVYGV